MFRLNYFLAWFDSGLSVGVTTFSLVVSSHTSNRQNRGIQPTNAGTALGLKGGTPVSFRVNLRALGFSSHALVYSASVLRGFSRWASELDSAWVSCLSSFFHSVLLKSRVPTLSTIPPSLVARQAL